MRRFIITLAAAAIGTFMFVAPLSAEPIFKYGLLKGQLIDSTTGEPVSGVDVMVYEWDDGATMADLAGGPSEATDENGRFSAFVSADNAVVYVNGLSQMDQRVYSSAFVGGPPLAEPFWPKFGQPWSGAGYTIPLSMVPDDTTRYKVAIDETIDVGQLEVEPTDRRYGFISGRTTDTFSGRGWFTTVNIFRFNEATSQWEITAGYGDSYGYFNRPFAGCFSIVGTAEKPLTGRIKVLFAPFYGANMANGFFGGATLEEAQELDIAPGESVTGLFVSLPALSRVRGRVFDAKTGAPVAGALVEADCYDPVKKIWRGVGIDFTASDGTYILPDAHGGAAGMWRISLDAIYAGRSWIMWYGQSGTAAGATMVNVPENSIVDGIDFALGTTSAIVGRTLDESGVPEPDIMVTAFRQSADGGLDYAGSTHTDSTGRYRLPTGSGGKYVVRFRDRAGTAAYGDDTVTYLGANQTVSGAVRLGVSTSKPRVVRDQRVKTADDTEAERTWAGSTQATALMTSRQTFGSGEASTAVIANGDRWGEALAAAGLAGAVDGPVLLTKRDKLDPALLDELDRLGVTKVYVVGNTSMIGIRQDRLLRACGFEVERIEGADHYDISANVAREIGSVSEITSATPAFVVSGSSRTDAALVGPAAFALGAPVLYVRASGTPTSVASAVADLDLETTYLVGSAEALPSTSWTGLSAAGAGIWSLTRDANGYTRAAQFAEAAFRRSWLECSAAGMTSYADSAGALGSAALLGRSGAPLLFGTTSQLPSATRAVLGAHTDTIGRVHVLADSTDIRTQVIIAAGSE